MDRENNGGKMGLKPIIDKRSGFCNGVIRAIREAENYLKKSEGNFNSLGSIVHNSREVERLNTLGVNIIDHDKIKRVKDATILIRAHGEPPSTYQIAKENNLKIIDCTCPVVLKLQKKIKEGYAKIKEQNGVLIIFGKKNHAEVNGLLGQVSGDAVVVESISDLEEIDFSKSIMVFSQTTKEPIAYAALIEEIERRSRAAGGGDESVISYNTICRQVSSRHPNLREFAKECNVVIFVSGKESSNGKVLFETCIKSNPRSYKIETTSQIDKRWFNYGDKVGICGATSTPTWQLEEVELFLKNL